MLHENNSEPHELEREVNGEIKNKFQNKVEFENEVNSFQMPANLVVAEFGEVNVRQETSQLNLEAAECHVEFTIAMEPQGRFAEGWRTGLALDASASMKRAYGRKVEARVDPTLLTDYIKQGRLRSYLEDGEPIRRIQREAFAEIQDRGYEISYTANILQPLVQDFAAYLAGSLDGTGKTSLIYWGCGKGDEIQVLGEVDAASCQQLNISGPTSFKLGKTTKLLPAIAYFAEQYRQAQHGMYIFLTDGRIDDLDQVKTYTKELALEIAVGKRNYLKLILIGIGKDVDRYQMQELDDFDTGLDIDLWDYKIASEMTNLTQIFAEVVNENQIIAENGSIYDDAGNCVKSYHKGLPAKVDFMMRADSQWFELEVGHQRIRQTIALGTAAAIAPFTKKTLFDFELQAQQADQKADQNIDQDDAQELDGILTAPSNLWKILAGLLVGAAFIGTAIAFAILIQRSDENKLQTQILPSAIKESVLNTKTDPNNNSNNNLPTSSANSNSLANSNNSNKSVGKSLADKSLADKSLANKSLTDASGNKSSKNPDKVGDKSSSNSSGDNENKLVNNSKNSSDPVINDNSKVNDNSKNRASQLTGDAAGKVAGDRNVNTSVLPITNPDLEVTIFFPSNETQLMQPEEVKIDNFWAKIQGRRGIIQISGHTDKTGDYAYNLDLSQARANEVVRMLRDRGLDNNYKVTFEALSWLQPSRKNNTATDNAFNRRVVIQFKEQR